MYSQTESDGILQEQQEQQQVCAEGEVFNEQTQMCESTATASTTTDLGTETLEELAPAELAPAELAPAELAPAELAPAELAPAELAPAELAPAELAPAEEVPAEEAPAEEVPAEEVPAEEVPAEEEKLVPPEELETPARELVAKSEEELQALEEQQQAPGQEATITIPEVVIRNYESDKYPCDPNSDTLMWDGKIPVKYNDKVVELQTYLDDLGFRDLLKPEGIDGKFGPHTKNAVMEFQKYHSIPADGIVGPETWRWLCSDIDNLN